MPLTAIAITTVARNAKIDDVATVAADDVNGNKYFNDGFTVLYIKNPTGGAITVTIVSVTDEAGRTGDLSVVVPATTGIGLVGPLAPKWWNQRASPDVGSVKVTWSATGATVAALKLTP